ncbi:hypothetical protein KAS79_00630 [Candidatus Parcubacteria bacterium]|nr:hypothetical protein [Candidatus Parcubacteria bacterium]
MQKENFLPCFYDPELRERLWYLFNYAEKEAQKFAEVNNNWVGIKCVMAGCAEKWNLVKDNTIYAEIQIVVNENNMAVLFHEIFHSAFHKSFLWHKDGMWGDAFCDSFRYFMEEKLLKEGERSKFFREMCECLNLNSQGIQDKFSDDKCHNLKYKIPTSIIIKKVNRDYDKFKNLWNELKKEYDRKQSAFLEDYFEFEMKKNLANFGQASDLII